MKQVWSANGATTVINVAGNATNGQVFGNTTALDNTEAYPYGLAVFSCAGFAVAPSANAPMELYAVRQNVDGTTDCTAGSTVDGTPAAESGFKAVGGAELVGVFKMSNSGGAQTAVCDIPLKGTANAKYVLRNASGQTCYQPITVKITPYSWGPT
jgi:hypothetical protein